jgi:hypothetical protein
MKSDHAVGVLIASFTVALMLLLIAVSIDGWMNCNDKGGAWVRGAFFYECVEKK